jgi:hypothetical protein
MSGPVYWFIGGWYWGTVLLLVEGVGYYFPIFDGGRTGTFVGVSGTVVVYGHGDGGERFISFGVEPVPGTHVGDVHIGLGYPFRKENG